MHGQSQGPVPQTQCMEQGYVTKAVKGCSHPQRWAEKEKKGVPLGWEEPRGPPLCKYPGCEPKAAQVTLRIPSWELKGRQT